MAEEGLLVLFVTSWTGRWVRILAKRILLVPIHMCGMRGNVEMQLQDYACRTTSEVKNMNNDRLTCWNIYNKVQLVTNMPLLTLTPGSMKVEVEGVKVSRCRRLAADGNVGTQAIVMDPARDR